MVSASSNRVIEVMNFLAAHPTESFTLTELASRLSLSHGSAHRVLGALTDASYLSRHPKHKTYSLGIALVAIGEAALEKHQSVYVARREMVTLAAQLGVQCIASAIIDDEMVFVAKEGVSQTYDGLSRVGERRPFIPPLALGHIAWSPPDEIEAYLAKLSETVSTEIKQYLRQSMAAIRERGYAIAAHGHGFSELHKLAALCNGDEQTRTDIEALINALSREEMQLLSLDKADSVPISYIAAPVFSPSGDVVLEVSLTGLPHDLSTSEITRYAERLRAAAAVITSETHGRRPKVNPA